MAEGHESKSDDHQNKSQVEEFPSSRDRTIVLLQLRSMGWRERRPMCGVLLASHIRAGGVHRRTQHPSRDALYRRFVLEPRMGQEHIGLMITAFTAAAGLCMGWLSMSDAKAQSFVLECSIGGQERSEL